MLVKITIISLVGLTAMMLAAALVPLIRNGQHDKTRTLRFLKYRVAFSALLLIFLVIAVLQGWVTPHGLTP